MHKIFCTKNAKKENLQHPVMDAVFLCRNPQKKYGKNKNSVYWMIENVEKAKKTERSKKNKKNKEQKNRKKIEKESKKLEAVRLRSAPKAP